MLRIIEKLNAEVLAVREKAASSPLTAGELSDYSYRIAVMQLCIGAVEFLYKTDTALPEGMVSWLIQKENSLECLCHLWIHSGYGFVPSLVDVLAMEIEQDMEVLG